MTRVVLTARIAPEWNEQTNPGNLAQASETDLRYNLLLGDVEIKIAGVDFSAKWGWVPLLDFVVGLIGLLRRFPTTGQEAFEFTESGAQLRFYLVDDLVEIRSNYLPAIARIGYVELMSAAQEFGDQTLQGLRLGFPALSENPAFERLSSQVKRADTDN